MGSKSRTCTRHTEKRREKKEEEKETKPREKTKPNADCPRQNRKRFKSLVVSSCDSSNGLRFREPKGEAEAAARQGWRPIRGADWGPESPDWGVFGGSWLV